MPGGRRLFPADDALDLVRIELRVVVAHLHLIVAHVLLEYSRMHLLL